jgi:hypothetical protein
MHRTRLAYNLRAHYRRIIAVSILIILTLYFQLFRRQQSRDESSIRPIELSRFSLDGLSGGTSSINFVVSATASENTQWLASHFPNATTALYIVDSTDSYSPFKTPANKGNEAMVYLTYIIDHYHKLPEIAVFFHGHLQSNAPAAAPAESSPRWLLQPEMQLEARRMSTVPKLAQSVPLYVKRKLPGGLAEADLAGIVPTRWGMAGMGRPDIWRPVRRVARLYTPRPAAELDSVEELVAHHRSLKLRLWTRMGVYMAVCTCEGSGLLSKYVSMLL